MLAPVLFTRPSRDLVAVHNGQTEVEKDDLRMKGANRLERGRAVPDRKRLVAERFEKHCEKLSGVRLVIHDEDTARQTFARHLQEVEARLASGRLEKRSRCGDATLPSGSRLSALGSRLSAHVCGAIAIPDDDDAQACPPNVMGLDVGQRSGDLSRTI